MRTTRQFLAKEVYLPRYMALASEDYDEKGAIFSFNIREPNVVRGDIVHYVTPRGLHICISQGSYALVENMIKEGKIEEMDVSEIRKILLTGRVKIAELYQRFRREIELSENTVQARFNLTRFRQGKTPILKLDFDFGNKAIQGNLVSMITPNPMPQTNSDLMRNPI